MAKCVEPTRCLMRPCEPTLPTAALLFFYFNIYYVDSPDCLLLFLSIFVFYF